MRSPRALVPCVVALAALTLVACAGEAPRRVYKVSLEGQSPPPPPEPPKETKIEPPAPLSAGSHSPSWLRASSPIQWTAPPGWEEQLSTAPTRLVEFTLSKDGPGGAPIQCLILYGGDAEKDPAAVKRANLERAQAFYREDRVPEMTTSEHDGVRVTTYKIHGTFEGYPRIGMSEPVKEDNWTLYFGWVEGPEGSLMFKCQGPDAIIKQHEPKIQMLLNSMKPRPKQQ